MRQEVTVDGKDVNKMFNLNLLNFKNFLYLQQLTNHNESVEIKNKTKKTKPVEVEFIIVTNVIRATLRCLAT